MGLLIERALRSVTLERQMRHQALAERIFDEMERGLSRLLEQEEQRAFDQYVTDAGPPAFPFVIAYFQVEPDGKVRVLPAGSSGAPPPELGQATGEIARIVSAFWSRE